MSIANALGEIFRRELDAQLVPLQEAVRRMEEGLEALELLRSVTHRLAPLTSRLGAMAGVRAPSALPAPAPGRGRQKQARLSTRGRPSIGKVATARTVGTRDEGARACAVIGCDRPSRSKGYCSAHYQKLRLLMRTNRRPAEWKDDAPPQSVEDVTLPRGRAASKALREGVEAPRAPEGATTAPAKGGRKAKKAASAKKAPRTMGKRAKTSSAKAADTKARSKKAPAKKAQAKKSPVKKAPAKKAAKGAKARAGKRKKGGGAQGSLF